MEITLLLIFGIWIAYALFGNRQRKFSTQNSSSPKSFRKKLNQQRLDVESLNLSDEQQEIFNILENNSNHVFVTGKAGTGKSALLQYFKLRSSKRLVVVAPTGVAALNVGGKTVHSLFGLAPTFYSREKLDAIQVRPKIAYLLRNIDVVVIDEVSMVRADLMDAIDVALREARGSEDPFGGVQIVMFGDLYQLPPVVNSAELHKYFAHNHGGAYFFNAEAWKTTSPEIYELTKVFRQTDEAFISVLNEIREGKVSDTALNTLNQRASVKIPEKGVITLATTNSAVNQINTNKLSNLLGELFEYKATITGDLQESFFPAETNLQLKKGAQVMFLRNDKQKRWVNGTIGFVEKLENDQIKVSIEGISYPVERETWNKIDYFYNQPERKVEEEVVGSFTQYPLRLAWAITIHKSQGQTYGSVAVDMGEGAFAHGQTYVGLSRCTSIEGIYLKREIFREDIIVDSSVLQFMKSARINKTSV